MQSQRSTLGSGKPFVLLAPCVTTAVNGERLAFFMSHEREDATGDGASSYLV